jgi:cell volume regulation protein A
VGNATAFASVLVLVLLIGLLAFGSVALTRRVALPAPAFLLLGAAVAARIVPGVHAPTDTTAERIVTVALVAILLDGGMRIGWPRFRAEAGAITLTGVLGTALTIAGAALVTHLVVGVNAYQSLLVATAVAPTDPAVVFSVLGERVEAGGAGTILAGESGVNDPVGIALMAALLGAGHLGLAPFAHVGGGFLSAMAVGAAFGIVGGGVLRRLVVRAEGSGGRLTPAVTAAGALLVYGGATLAHGSGFLAVFMAGIVLGNLHGRNLHGRNRRNRRRVKRFHAAAAGIGEIAVFTVLGLTVDLSELTRTDVWLPGIVLGAVLALAIRPVLVGASLLPVHLPRTERSFVLFSGLKGAVPLLLGLLLVAAHVPHASRLYGIVVVVVVFSVVVQGTLTPYLAAALHLSAGDGDPGRSAGDGSYPAAYPAAYPATNPATAGRTSSPSRRRWSRSSRSRSWR